MAQNMLQLIQEIPQPKKKDHFWPLRLVDFFFIFCFVIVKSELTFIFNFEIFLNSGSQKNILGQLILKSDRIIVHFLIADSFVLE